MDFVQYKFASPLGSLFLCASSVGLRGVFIQEQNIPLTEALQGDSKENKIIKKTCLQLTEYFEGKRKLFDIPLDIQGTPFEESVWSELKRIPYGKTVSYKDIAKRIKKPNAVRAVGNANGKNPVCIVIPCHRVISSNGALGGYSGGIKMKEYLINLERF